jgi:hypothetical protein
MREWWDMLAYMLQEDDVTTDEQPLNPPGFDPDGQGSTSWTESVFLSFTTLSSTGLSGITPISVYARSVLMLEQIAGLFYVPMVVTRLVALRGERTRRPSA